MDGIQLSLFGKTFPAPFHPTVEKISGSSLKNSQKSAGGGIQFLDLRAENGNMLGKSWAMGSVLHGGDWMRNTGEFPSAAAGSTLWQILEEDAPERYYLSAKACEGILRRAERRGKALPKMLREALEEAVALGA